MKITLSFLLSISLATISFCQNSLDTLGNEAYFIKQSSIVDSLCHRGKAQECLSISEDLLVWAEKQQGQKSGLYGRALSNAAVPYYFLGQYKRALDYFEQSEAIIINTYGEVSKHYHTIMSISGLCYKNLGDWNKALPIMKSNLERGKVVFGENSAPVASSYNNMSLIYNRTGQLDKAIECQEKALEINKNLEDNEEYVILFSSGLAELYRNAGRLEKAYQLITEAEKMCLEVLGTETSRYINALWIKIRICLSTDRVDEAVEAADNILPVAYRIFGKNHIKTTGVATRAASAYGRAGDFQKALDCINNNLNRQGKFYGEFHSYYMNTLKEKASLLNLLNRPEEALSTFLEVQKWLQWSVSEQFPHYNEKLQSRLISTTYLINDATQSFNLMHSDLANASGMCFDNLLLIKSILRENQKSFLQKIKTNSSEDLAIIVAEWEELKRTLSKQYNLPLAKRHPQLDSLEERAQNLESEMILFLPQDSRAKEEISWKLIQNELKEGEVVIEFSHFKNQASNHSPLKGIQYIAYVLSHDAKTPIIIPLFEEKEVGNLKAIRSLYSPTISGGKANLRQLIWEPLASHLEDKKTIYFSPSGLLNRVNFGAIPISTTQTINEKFQLYQLGSSRDLVKPSEQTVEIKDAVVYGGIQYEMDSLAMKNKLDEFEISNPVDNSNFNIGDRNLRGNDWDYLPYTMQEVNSITNILKKQGTKVELLTDYAANEEHFKTLGSSKKSPEIIHLATHGYFFPKIDKSSKIGAKSSKNPLVRSGLILAGANQVWKGESSVRGMEDGILTAYEITQMDLSNTELVVLSACETGLGDIEGSEGVYGLQRAFKIAGAKYILMSLWNVQDKKTYEFMTRFYELYQTEGKSVTDAYQLTQKEMRLRYDLANPNAWAGFILIK